MYRLSSNSSPSITAWDQLNGELLACKTQMTKLNGLTELEVTELTSSMVDDTALAILKRQGIRGIIIASWPRTFTFDIQVDPYRQKWHTKCSKLAAKDFDTSEFQQDRWNRYLMLGLLWNYIPWNATSNLGLWWSFKEVWSVLLLPSGTTLTNILWRKYALTMDAIMKQLPSRNDVRLALD